MTIQFFEKLKKKHYIQCGLAVLLTGLFLFLTSPLWLSKVVVVSFNADVEKDIEYRVFYTIESGKSFNEHQSVRRVVKSGRQKVDIVLPISNIIRLRIDMVNASGKTSIYNLQVRGSHIEKLDYNAFKPVNINKYEVKDDKISIISKQKNPYLRYLKELNLPAEQNIDWYVLVIFATLSFLVFYKLVKYLAKFKLQGFNSRIDIVMLVVFFCLLWVPMSQISDDTKSEQENRVLAKYRPLWQKGHFNYQFGTDFEKWYNDRFLGRNLLISLYNHMKFSLSEFVRNERAIKASDDMIFNMEILNTLSNPISDKVKKEISDNIAELQKFTQKNNIDLYIMIPPSKEDIYKYKLSKIFSNIDREKSIIYDLQKYISEKNKLDIIYPRDIYLRDYKDLTHSKIDHHWTEFGAFLGYGELIYEIRKKHHKIQKLEEKNFDTFYKDQPRLGEFSRLFERHYYKGSDCYRLGVISHCPLYPHKYYDYKDLKNLKVKYGPMNMSRITHYNEGLDANVTLLGNSYGGFLMEFLPYNFKNVQMLRFNNGEKGIKNIYDMKRFENHILDFKTDILILIVASSYIDEFQKLYKED